MSIAEIQQRVLELPTSERQKLACWMAKQFAPLSVGEFVRSAEADVIAGHWKPQPIAEHDLPTGEALKQAQETAGKLRDRH